MTRQNAPSLFEDAAPRPLADRLRPRALDEVVGQDHLLRPDGPLGRMVASGALASTVLWGPPGCGKTTIARLLADHTDLLFAPLSAVFSGVAELRKVFADAREHRAGGTGTLLFVDEIHRFNRAQQDAFLPVVEDGTVILVGATTENPSFELNGAPALALYGAGAQPGLDDGALETLLTRAEEAEGRTLPLSTDARPMLRAMADGDGRALINLAEALFAAGATGPLDVPQLMETVQRRAPLYDKSQEGHYNLISALHKSLRGSDTDAALYWLRAHARRRRGPPLYRPSPGALRRRGRGAGRPGSAAAGARRLGGLRAAGIARGRARHRPNRDLSRHRGEIERELPRARAGHEGGARDRLVDAAQAHPQRADAADEDSATARATSTTTTPRKGSRPELLSGGNAAAQLLTSRASGASSARC